MSIKYKVDDWGIQTYAVNVTHPDPNRTEEQFKQDVSNIVQNIAKYRALLTKEQQAREKQGGLGR